MEKSIYNLQKFLLIQTKLNSQITDKLSNAYIYAWSEDCYPLFDSGSYHKDLEQYFKITKVQVDTISKYADEEWLQKRYYTFYQYEDYFQNRSENLLRINRLMLLRVFRYMYLSNFFDNKFWETLLTPMEYPIEANGIIKNFDLNEIYFF